MPTTCLPAYSTRHLADCLTAGLRVELDLTPKPGLVDRRDSGSHPDLTHGIMDRSITLLDGYLTEYAAALEAGAGAAGLRRLGMAAEARMSAHFGTNTHRGAIFLGGVLLAGLHRAASRDDMAVSHAIGGFALELFADRVPTDTTGARVRARYGVGGIVAEALDGLPCVFRTGLPALREARQRLWPRDRALYLLMARLMRTVEDTTALRRCGPAGLARLRRDGARLEERLLAGLDPVPFLVEANDDYRRQRLTMGGVADLIGTCAAWASFTGLWGAEPRHAGAKAEPAPRRRLPGAGSRPGDQFPLVCRMPDSLVTGASAKSLAANKGREPGVQP
jgi:triphosphoribosyl-dephospho-CoA synthetase